MKVWNGKTQHRYAHVKRDGHWMLAKKTQMGEVKCYSRGMELLDLRWCKFYERLVTLLPVGTTVHGELWTPGEEASYVKSAIVKKDHRLVFEVFAVPTMNHLLPLHVVADYVNKWGLPFIPWYDSEYKTGDFHECCIGTFTDPSKLPLRSDIEGYVMKDCNFGDFLKVKPFLSADLIVTGVKPGKRKYEGMVGALICSLHNGEEVANISGFTDEERRALSESDIGRVVEVKYQKVGSRGRLRHPTFVRFRDDKKPEECTEL